MLHNFPNNPGYLLHKFTDKELEPIWAEVNTYPQSGSDKSLHKTRIEGDRYLRDCHTYLERLLVPHVDAFIQGFDFGFHLSREEVSQKLGMSRSWVNFHTKHDYNPSHNHFGQLSFVIWLRIPYTFEQENLLHKPKDGYSKMNGDFHFQWIDTTGLIRSHSLDADASRENYLCLFPATLHHNVFPFYSTDETRITVSGNWRFQ
jgi:AraC-like DNA-binding protein